LKSGNVAKYNFITPNVCDDMHDACSGDPIAHGDQWLARNIPTILKSRAYQQGGAIFITWDEANSGDGPIGMIVLSPFAKGHGYSNSVGYTHGSTLRTVQEIFSLKPFLRDANREKDLSDLFKVFP
jgi:phosphatidylinositol-3-phosphatase